MSKIWTLLVLLSLAQLVYGQKFEDYKAFSSGSGGISAVAYHPQGTSFASGNSLGTILVRNVSLTPGELPTPLSGHKGEITHLSYHKSGRYLVSASKDGTVKVWDISTKKAIFSTHIKEQGAANGHYAFAFFSTDGQAMIYGGSDGKLMITRPLTNNTSKGVISTYDHAFYCADQSANGNYVVAGSKNNVKVIDFYTKKPLMVIKSCSGWVVDVKYTPDNSKIGSLCADGTFALWDAKTGAPLDTWKVTSAGKSTQIAFSDDGKYLVTGDTQGTPKVWDMATKALLSDLTGHRAPVRSVAFSPNSKFIVSGGEDSQVKIWQWKQVIEAAVLPVVDDDIPLPPPPPISDKKYTPTRLQLDGSDAQDAPETFVPTIIPVTDEAEIKTDAFLTEEVGDVEIAPTITPEKVATNLSATTSPSKVNSPPKNPPAPPTEPNTPDEENFEDIVQAFDLPASLDGVQIAYNSRGKPDSLGTRRIKSGRRVRVKYREIEVIVWDEEVEDGDTISIFLNGQWLLKEYALTNAKKKIKVRIQQGDDNHMILYAHNEGTRPPNTAAIAILDGKNKQHITLNSDLKNCDAINFQYDNDD